MKKLLLAAASVVAFAAPANAVLLKYTFSGTLNYAGPSSTTGSVSGSFSGFGDTASASTVGLFGATLVTVPLTGFSTSPNFGFALPAGGSLTFATSGDQVGLIYNPGQFAIGFSGTTGYDGVSPLAATPVTLSFSNPAPLSFNGYTLTGGSGTFAAGAVPEPATWALMVLGFGLAGASVRRRRTAGQASA